MKHGPLTAPTVPEFPAPTMGASAARLRSRAPWQLALLAIVAAVGLVAVR